MCRRLRVTSHGNELAPFSTTTNEMCCYSHHAALSHVWVVDASGHFRQAVQERPAAFVVLLWLTARRVPGCDDGVLEVHVAAVPSDLQQRRSQGITEQLLR